MKNGERRKWREGKRTIWRTSDATGEGVEKDESCRMNREDVQLEGKKDNRAERKEKLENEVPEK